MVHPKDHILGGKNWPKSEAKAGVDDPIAQVDELLQKATRLDAVVEACECGIHCTTVAPSNEADVRRELLKNILKIAKGEKE